MPTYSAPVLGGTVRASLSSDTITGSGAFDTLAGLAGDDIINGGGGNDRLEGDGMSTYADAFRLNGSAISDFTGDARSATGIDLVASGYYGAETFWTIRNSSDVERVVTLKHAGSIYIPSGIVMTITLPANSQAVIPSAQFLAHQIVVDGVLQRAVAYSSAAFDVNAAFYLGPDGNDVLDGGNGADTLYGNGGNDILTGGNGADWIDGGDGIDTVSYGNAPAGVALSFSATDSGGIGGLYSNRAAGGYGGAAFGDTLINVEAFIGSIYVDRVGGSATTAMTYSLGDGDDMFDTATTSAVDDEVYGGAGNDTARGAGGNDKLFGEAGDDVLDGETGDDFLYGGVGNDTVSGGSGNDLLAGGAGADQLIGGDGVDTADYSASATGVVVGLLTGSVLQGGDAQGDTLSGVENLIGSAFNDTLKGDLNANSLSGGAGDDQLAGGGGADQLDGGEGADTATYGASTQAVTLSLLTGLGQGGHAEGDTLVNIEHMSGSAYADVLIGDARSNSLWGLDGNDTLSGGDGNDIIDGGTGNDLLAGGAGADQLIGGDGDDTADYSASSAAITINLASAMYSGGDAAGDTHTSIERIIGTGFGDSLTGDATANAFQAGAGNDIIYGSGGGDTLDGGADIDLVTYAASTGGVTVNLMLGTGVGGHAQGDVLSNIENLVGSSFADTITGNAAANTIDGGNGADSIKGGDGDDVVIGADGDDWLFGDAGVDRLEGGLGTDRLTGGAGADSLHGGDGSDTVDYRHSSAAVTVNLATGSGLGGDAEGDVLQSIENLSGSSLDDTLTGDNGVNRLTGAAGSDSLYGMGGNDYFVTGAGYDYVDGGDGVDTVTYEDSWDRVVVNLTSGKNQYGEASRDVLVNVENIVGSAFDDTITGDAGANRLTGGDGNDVMNGMAGIDYLFGGAGNDTLTGGTGADVFVFNPGFGDDVITDFWAGVGRTDRIWFQTAGVAGQVAPEWHITDSASGAVITIDGQGSLTLTGVTAAQLHADDFIFS